MLKNKQTQNNNNNVFMKQMSRHLFSSACHVSKYFLWINAWKRDAGAAARAAAAGSDAGGVDHAGGGHDVEEGEEDDKDGDEEDYRNCISWHL